MTRHRRTTPQSSTIFDRILLVEFRSGKSKAFEMLWQRHERKINSIIYSIVKSSASTEDVSQETAIGAFKALTKNNEMIADIPAFLAVIARRRAHEFLRTLLRHRHRRPISLSPEHDCACDTSRYDYYEWLARVTRLVFESLSTDDQHIINQYHFESLTQEQIAMLHRKTRSRIGQKLRAIHAHSREQFADLFQ